MIDGIIFQKKTQFCKFKNIPDKLCISIQIMSKIFTRFFYGICHQYELQIADFSVFAG